jgi:hypothetical protein
VPACLLQYDEAIAAALNKVNAKATFKGQLDVYRFCDNVSSPALVLSGPARLCTL